MTHNFTFFYGSFDPFSNWYQPNKFIHAGVEYNCSEQYMMHKKALLFNDIEVANLIMEQIHPRQQKMLGKEVRGFVKSIWDENCQDIMVEGLISKFTQNERLKQTLLNTGETILVEASPYDKIWGIGLSENDPRALDETKWLGQNLLGKVLMRVRNVIR
jgi:ribA/ribD-fused uncharacterized protein